MYVAAIALITLLPAAFSAQTKPGWCEATPQTIVSVENKLTHSI